MSVVEPRQHFSNNLATDSKHNNKPCKITTTETFKRFMINQIPLPPLPPSLQRFKQDQQSQCIESTPKIFKMNSNENISQNNDINSMQPIIQKSINSRIKELSKPFMEKSITTSSNSKSNLKRVKSLGLNKSCDLSDSFCKFETTSKLIKEKLNLSPEKINGCLRTKTPSDVLNSSPVIQTKPSSSQHSFDQLSSQNVPPPPPPLPPSQPIQSTLKLKIKDKHILDFIPNGNDYETKENTNLKSNNCDNQKNYSQKANLVKKQFAKSNLNLNELNLNDVSLIKLHKLSANGKPTSNINLTQLLKPISPRDEKTKTPDNIHPTKNSQTTPPSSSKNSSTQNSPKLSSSPTTTQTQKKPTKQFQTNIYNIINLISPEKAIQENSQLNQSTISIGKTGNITNGIIISPSSYSNDKKQANNNISQLSPIHSTLNSNTSVNKKNLNGNNNNSHTFSPNSNNTSTSTCSTNNKNTSCKNDRITNNNSKRLTGFEQLDLIINSALNQTSKPNKEDNKLKHSQSKNKSSEFCVTTQKFEAKSKITSTVLSSNLLLNASATLNPNSFSTQNKQLDSISNDSTNEKKLKYSSSFYKEPNVIRQTYSSNNQNLKTNDEATSINKKYTKNSSVDKKLESLQSPILIPLPSADQYEKSTQPAYYFPLNVDKSTNTLVEESNQNNSNSLSGQTNPNKQDQLNRTESANFSKSHINKYTACRESECLLYMNSNKAKSQENLVSNSVNFQNNIDVYKIKDLADSINRKKLANSLIYKKPSTDDFPIKKEPNDQEANYLNISPLKNPSSMNFDEIKKGPIKSIFDRHINYQYGSKKSELKPELNEDMKVNLDNQENERLKSKSFDSFNSSQANFDNPSTATLISINENSSKNDPNDILDKIQSNNEETKILDFKYLPNGEIIKNSQKIDPQTNLPKNNDSLTNPPNFDSTEIDKKNKSIIERLISLQTSANVSKKTQDIPSISKDSALSSTDQNTDVTDTMTEFKQSLLIGNDFSSDDITVQLIDNLDLKSCKKLFIHCFRVEPLSSRTNVTLSPNQIVGSNKIDLNCNSTNSNNFLRKELKKEINLPQNSDISTLESYLENGYLVIKCFLKSEINDNALSIQENPLASNNSIGDKSFHSIQNSSLTHLSNSSFLCNDSGTDVNDKSQLKNQSNSTNEQIFENPLFANSDLQKQTSIDETLNIKSIGNTNTKETKPQNNYNSFGKSILKMPLPSNETKSYDLINKTYNTNRSNLGRNSKSADHLNDQTSDYQKYASNIYLDNLENEEYDESRSNYYENSLKNEENDKYLNNFDLSDKSLNNKNMKKTASSYSVLNNNSNSCITKSVRFDMNSCLSKTNDMSCGSISNPTNHENSFKFEDNNKRLHQKGENKNLNDDEIGVTSHRDRLKELAYTEKDRSSSRKSKSPSGSILGQSSSTLFKSNSKSSSKSINKRLSSDSVQDGFNCITRDGLNNKFLTYFFKIPSCSPRDRTHVRIENHNILKLRIIQEKKYFLPNHTNKKKRESSKKIAKKKSSKSQSLRYSNSPTDTENASLSSLSSTSSISNVNLSFNGNNTDTLSSSFSSKSNDSIDCYNNNIDMSAKIMLREFSRQCRLPDNLFKFDETGVTVSFVNSVWIRIEIPIISFIENTINSHSSINSSNGHSLKRKKKTVANNLENTKHQQNDHQHSKSKSRLDKNSNNNNNYLLENQCCSMQNIHCFDCENI